MPPRSELNERFQSYQKSSHRLRTFGTVLLSSGLVVGSAFAFEVVAPPKSEARAHIEQSLAQATAAFSSVVHSINNALSSFGTTRPISYARIGNGSQSAAAAATISTTHSIGTSTSTTTPKTAKAPTPSLPPPKASAPQTIVRNIYIPASGQVLGATTVSQLAFVSPLDLANLRSSFEAELNTVANNLHLEMSHISNPPPYPAQVAAGGTTVIYQSSPVPAAQRIDKLQNTTITDPSITGGSISNASIAATTLSAGATTLGATNATSLNVSGASVLSGDLNIGGTLTANTLTVASVTSGGAVAAPYFSATSTTATSSFAGNIAVTGNASSTNLFASVANFTTGIINTLTSTIANFGTITATNATLTNATSTNHYTSNLAAAAARFGSTATSSFNSAGVLTLASALTVANGGTGQTSFGQGWLNSDGTTISASTSPTVAYLTATSSTATSTFAGGVAIGNGSTNTTYLTFNSARAWTFGAEGSGGSTSLFLRSNTAGKSFNIEASDGSIVSQFLANINSPAIAATSTAVIGFMQSGSTALDTGFSRLSAGVIGWARALKAVPQVHSSRQTHRPPFSRRTGRATSARRQPQRSARTVHSPSPVPSMYLPAAPAPPPGRPVPFPSSTAATSRRTTATSFGTTRTTASASEQRRPHFLSMSWVQGQKFLIASVRAQLILYYATRMAH